jgi:hypothetical protein
LIINRIIVSYDKTEYRRLLLLFLLFFNGCFCSPCYNGDSACGNVAAAASSASPEETLIVVYLDAVVGIPLPVP